MRVAYNEERDEWQRRLASLLSVVDWLLVEKEVEADGGVRLMLGKRVEGLSAEGLEVVDEVSIDYFVKLWDTRKHNLFGRQRSNVLGGANGEYR